MPIIQPIHTQDLLVNKIKKQKDTFFDVIDYPYVGEKIIVDLTIFTFFLFQAYGLLYFIYFDHMIAQFRVKMDKNLNE